MAGQLPVLSGSQVRKVFEKSGWEYARQRGSHMVMVKEGHIATLSVPNHKTVAKGTLRSLIRASGLSVDQFVELV
jgi:hypothetical protein